MKLEGAKLLSESEEEFRVHHPEHGELRIAKGHLHHGTVNKIKQHFACGGEVQHMADGGEVDPLDFFAAEDPFKELGLPPPPPPKPEAPPAGQPIQAVLPPELAALHAPFEQPQAITQPQFHNIQLAGQAKPAAAPQSQAPGAPPEIAAGMRQQQQAVAQEGQAKQAGFAEQAQIQNESAQRQQAQAQQTQAMLADRSARAEQLFNAVANSKVDPNRFWESKSTGQKIGSSIALILGGIGAGLTKGPNYAMEVINRGIDMDMEAQKVNLGKSQSLLAHYMQQTRDLEAASRLAKADYLDITAARLQAATAKMGSAAALPQSQAQIGALRTQAATLRQEGTLRQQQIQQGNLGVQQQQMQVDAFRALMKGMAGGGGFNRQILEMPGFEKYRERSVQLPDGSLAFGKDKEEATKSNEAFATVARLKPKLQRYMQLLNSGSPETLDRGSAQSMHADLLSEMGHLHDLNRLTDVDLELFKEQVPDISRWLSSKGQDRQRLKGVEKSLGDKVWAEIKKYSDLPDKARPGG